MFLDVVLIALVLALVVRAVRNDKADKRPLGGGGSGGSDDNTKIK